MGKVYTVFDGNGYATKDYVDALVKNSIEITTKTALVPSMLLLTTSNPKKIATINIDIPTGEYLIGIVSAGITPSEDGSLILCSNPVLDYGTKTSAGITYVAKMNCYLVGSGSVSIMPHIRYTTAKINS